MPEQHDAKLHQDVGRVLGILEGVAKDIVEVKTDFKSHMEEEEKWKKGIEEDVTDNKIKIKTMGNRVTLISSVLVTVALTGADWVKKHVLGI